MRVMKTLFLTALIAGSGAVASSNADTPQTTAIVNLTQQANRLKTELDTAEGKLLEFQKEHDVLRLAVQRDALKSVVVEFEREVTRGQADLRVLEDIAAQLEGESDDVIRDVLHRLKLEGGDPAAGVESLQRHTRALKITIDAKARALEEAGANYRELQATMATQETLERDVKRMSSLYDLIFDRIRQMEVGDAAAATAPE